MNLQWKGGQLKLPNGPDQNLFLELKLVYFKLFELNLITQSNLELLYDLVTQL